jgi:hypothetical protein
VGKNYLFFALEVKVNSSLADAHLLRQILHGHLLIAISGEQVIGRVEDGVSDTLFI